MQYFTYRESKAVLVTTDDLIRSGHVGVRTAEQSAMLMKTWEDYIATWKKDGVNFVFLVTTLPFQGIPQVLREVLDGRPKNCFFGNLYLQ